jgi:ferritin-like metal-binding protein YciE
MGQDTVGVKHRQKIISQQHAARDVAGMSLAFDPGPAGPASFIARRSARVESGNQSTNGRGESTMEMQSLRELYVKELKDLYSAEKQLVKALPKMAKNSNSPELKKAFTDHLEETEGHVERLEQVFEMLGESNRGKKCKGMEGLIEEAKELLEEDASQEVLDAGMISKAQHVEHYEMAGYGTVRTYARQLGLDEQADLLQETLDEEGKANELLTQIAESSVNIEAELGGEEEESTSRTRGDRQVSRSVATEGKRTTTGGGKGRGTGRSRPSRAAAR